MANALPSKKQHALLAFIDAFIAENNYAPSYREVMRALDYKSVSTVANHINGLIERGWLVKRDNSARSVEVVYKDAKGTTGQPPVSPEPPTPSLPVEHETWLKQVIDSRMNDQENPVSEHDRAAIQSTLQLLGFDSLAQYYRPVSVEEEKSEN